MKPLTTLVIFSVVGIFSIAFKEIPVEQNKIQEDMLTPSYYLADESDPFRNEVEKFIAVCRSEKFHHPLMNEKGKIPEFKVYNWGTFGAGKPPGRNIQHHPAVDFKVGNRQTIVPLYAAHKGRISTFRDAPKYRHYLSISKDITMDGKTLGKVVTIYGHIDLDLNEADGLSLDGRLVEKGDLVSRHLFSGTRGGPHLHLEIRYYRAGDTGKETFYGFRIPGQESELTVHGIDPWPYGFWNPEVGYGFADPRNFGISCE